MKAYSKPVAPSIIVELDNAEAETLVFAIEDYLKMGSGNDDVSLAGMVKAIKKAQKGIK